MKNIKTILILTLVFVCPVFAFSNTNIVSGDQSMSSVQNSNTIHIDGDNCSVFYSWSNRADSTLKIDMGSLHISGDTVSHQFMHPDWDFYPGGWGPIPGESVVGCNSEGELVDGIVGSDSPQWQYWAGFTAYFNGNGFYERPHIRVSNDKENWFRPFAINIYGDTIWTPDPIYEASDFNNGDNIALHHFADTEIIFKHSSALWCLFTAENQFNLNPVHIWVMGMSSPNGISWNKNDTCHLIVDSNKSFGGGIRFNMLDCISPTINHESSLSGNWEMWFVDICNHTLGAESTFVIKMTNPDLDTTWYHYDGSGVAVIDTCYLTPPADSMNIWHIQVRQPPWGGPERFMLATFSSDVSGSGNFGQYLYYSDDYGVNWQIISKEPIIPCSYPDSGFDSKTYRSSFIFEEVSNIWKLAVLYSVQSGIFNNVWGTAYTDILVCNTTPGDANLDHNINLLDIIFTINYVLKNNSNPGLIRVVDTNGDGMINILDLTYLIFYIYKNGPPPVCPE